MNKGGNLRNQSGSITLILYRLLKQLINKISKPPHSTRTNLILVKIKIISVSPPEDDHSRF